MPSGLTIADTAARCGLPESTLRYWEQIGLVPPVQRDPSSGYRRYSPDEVRRLETLANLRAVGMSIEDMRRYLDDAVEGDAAAVRQRDLFRQHAERVAADIEVLRLRQTYLDLKVRYWDARAAGDPATADTVAAELDHVIRGMRSDPRLQEEQP